MPLALAFIAAGVGIGAVETAENATVASAAPEDKRGSAFGLLAVIQAGGDLVASAVWRLLFLAYVSLVAFTGAERLLGTRSAKEAS